MALRVLCKDRPQRSIALATAAGITLTFEYSPTVTSSLSDSCSDISLPPRCVVEFANEFPWADTDYRHLGSGSGTLGLITLNSDVFICVITESIDIASPRPHESVQRIDSVQFYCLNRPDYDIGLTTIDESTAQDDFSREPDYGSAFQGKDFTTEFPFLALKKLLGDGSFFYSTNFSLTDRLQERIDHDTYDIELLDKDFLWNSYMIAPLIQFRSNLTDHDRQLLDSSHILTSVIRGFVRSLKLPVASPFTGAAMSNDPTILTLISRLSSRRAGTRFNSRGIDDDGHVSNFVETETILWIPPNKSFSYTQIRGSIPTFWEQSPGLLPGQQKIDLTRSETASQRAFDKHVQSLQLEYSTVHAINLLSETKPNEVKLSNRYRNHVAKSSIAGRQEAQASAAHELFRWTDFDYHAETRGLAYDNAALIRHKIAPSFEGFGYFLALDKDVSTQTSWNWCSVLLEQQGVFRTNCLDCLDRTNSVQMEISRMALEKYFLQLVGTPIDEFWRSHSSLWADNGDMLSKIYAGTGALRSSFTRHGKASFQGALADARKSVSRFVNGHLTDEARQKTIEILLGLSTTQANVYLYDPLSDRVRKSLAQMSDKYTSTGQIRIWTGTFNVNGLPLSSAEDLGLWLHGHFTSASEEPMLIAVGLQEIVELSPQQIMSTDPSNRQIWEEAVKRTLDRETSRKGTSKYILLRSGQLVGAALLLFAKEDVLKDIKNVEGSVKKTGLSGMAGNKGGCAIRLQYSNTRLCFVTAHLAAGFSNYEERNRDYNIIAGGLRFQRNRCINDHDAVIWLGDFNYRIGLSDDKVRCMIHGGNLEKLYAHDQLHLQMVAGYTFQHYSEGPITFPPTYRYNNGTDTYDTSEKRRVPAWCDRILWRGGILNQLEYNTAPLKFSDHRPVYAVFECSIRKVDKEIKQRLSRELYQKYKENDKESLESTSLHSASDHSGEGENRGISSGLPPPSSDRRLPVRSSIESLTGQAAVPRRSPNPFSAANERDQAHSSDPDMPRSNPIGIDYVGYEPSGKAISGVSSDEPITPKKAAPPVPRKPHSLRSTKSRGKLLDTDVDTEVQSLYRPLDPQK